MKIKITKTLFFAFGLLGTAGVSNAQVVNDSCMNAISINSVFGGAAGVIQTAGPYDNTGSTANGDDPATGWSCYGEPTGSGTAPSLERTVWFTFTGDGSIYFIESGSCAGVTNYIDDGDTQFSLYTGTCGSLTSVACNDDGPNAVTGNYISGLTVNTVAGTVYYLMVDGFNFNGTISIGQFCLNVTKQATVSCADPSVTVGTGTQNVINLCFDDTLVVTATGVVAPNSGSFYGIGWVISNASISGSFTPISGTTFIASYTFSMPAPSVSSRQFINDGTSAFITPGSTYYWTPVVFADASQASAGAPVFLHDLTLDPLCTFTGTSMQVNVLAQNDPLCVTGIQEHLPGRSAALYVYPSPATSEVKLDFMSSSPAGTTIMLSDYTGRIVDQKIVKAIAGVNTTVLPVSHLAPGIYCITVTDATGKRAVRFTKD